MLNADVEQTAQSVRRVPVRAASIWMWLARVVFPVLVLAIWQYLSNHRILSPLFVGDPIGIVGSLWDGIVVTHGMLEDLGWTLLGTVLAFALGSIAGIATGLVFSVYGWLERFAEPYLAALNSLPRIALAPLFILWLGLGLTSKVAAGFSLTFFILLGSTVAGTRSVDPDLVTLARTLGARPAEVFVRVILPSAVPTIFAGLRLGLIYALLGVVAAEIMGAEHGLGQSVSYLANTFQTNGLFAVLVLLAAVGGGLSWFMSALEARLLVWR